MNALLIALGGGIGAVARYGVNRASASIVGDHLPLGTFIVNVLGSFLMGLIMAFLMRKYSDNEGLRLFLTTGILGGFTTFSAFSMDVLNYVQHGEQVSALIYIVASVVVSIAALFFGFWAIRLVVA